MSLKYEPASEPLHISVKYLAPPRAVREVREDAEVEEQPAQRLGVEG